MRSFPHHHSPREDDVVDIMREGFWRSIPVALANDETLSDSALAAATWMLTRPDDYVLIVGVICRRFGWEPGGRKWVRVRRELEAGGYWVSERIDGKWRHRFNALGRFKPPLQNAGVQNAGMQNAPVRINRLKEQREFKKPPPPHARKRVDPTAQPANSGRPCKRERAEPQEGREGGGDANRLETEKQMQALLDAAAWGEERAGRPPGPSFRPWKRRALITAGATVDDWDLLAAHQAHMASRPSQQDQARLERVREINVVLASLESAMTEEVREFELQRLRQLAPNHPRLHDQRTGKKTAASAGRPS